MHYHAIIRLDGMIMEGSLKYVHDQIDKAAGDEHVKAVVLRITSPGGSMLCTSGIPGRILFGSYC